VCVVTQDHPPPNLGFDIFGSLRRMLTSNEISDYRNAFQVRARARASVRVMM
jgi:hypothetical protein